jgi:hypothetical protein
MRKLTRIEIIDRLSKKHPEYDYSLLPGDVTTKSKLRVVCLDHGEFNPTYHDHLHKGSKCPECSRLKKAATQSDFIRKAQKVHGNRYDYSTVRYVNNEIKVTIICPEHGPFEQTPYSHTCYSNGCPSCATNNRRKTKDEFVREANKIHKGAYDYSSVVYSNIHSHVTIVCSEHGPFEQTPTNHLHQQAGCPRCASHVKYTKRYFATYPEISSTPGVLYVVRMFDDAERFLKVGITKHWSVEQRYEQSPETGYEIELVNSKKLPLGEAYDTEQHILRNMRQQVYVPRRNFSGKTECLEDTESVLSSLEGFFKENKNGIAR